MPSAEPLIHWPQPFLELASFVASFLASGAIGYRYGALRALLRSGSGVIAAEREVCERSAARAAVFGLAGALIGATLLVERLPALAARQQLGVAALLGSDGMLQTQIALLVVAVGGFAIAARGRDYGWPLAALGVVAGALRAAFTLQWARLVNPIHVLAGGLWIGTLAMLVLAGFSAVFASRLDTERRGALAARMVGGFSPLALGATGVLALFGIITAWRHLDSFELLWRSPYGIALLVKLSVVVVVVGFGAWNWRRLKPWLGSEDAARAIGRSARIELAFASVVLVITAVLVSLPDARLPGR